MKILINAVSAKSGGAVTYIRNLVAELPNRGNQYVYIVCSPPMDAGSDQELKANMRFIQTDVSYRSFWRRFLWDQITLRRILKRERVDILWSSSDFGMVLPPCRQILLLRNSLFFSDLFLEKILPRKSWRSRMVFLLKRMLIMLSARSSDFIVTASESMLRDVRRFITIPNGKMMVNYFGVQLAKFNRSCSRGENNLERVREETLRILYVSEYSDHKNLTTLLNAMFVLVERGFRDFSLTTTAHPAQFPEAEIISREVDKRLASDARISAHVKFVGAVPYDEVQALYHASDIFIFPSLAESFGHPLVEAMASALPIIASDIPICREICGDAAVYFDPLNANGLAEKILLLRNNTGLRRHLGQLGRARADAHFKWNDHVERLVELFEKFAA